MLTTCQRDWTEHPVPGHHHAAPIIARLAAQTSQKAPPDTPGPPPPRGLQNRCGERPSGSRTRSRLVASACRALRACPRDCGLPRTGSPRSNHGATWTRPRGTRGRAGAADRRTPPGHPVTSGQPTGRSPPLIPVSSHPRSSLGTTFPVGRSVGRRGDTRSPRRAAPTPARYRQASQAASGPWRRCPGRPARSPWRPGAAGGPCPAKAPAGPPSRPARLVPWPAPMRPPSSAPRPTPTRPAGRRPRAGPALGAEADRHRLRPRPTTPACGPSPRRPAPCAAWR